jgi:hypothetical protein
MKKWPTRQGKKKRQPIRLPPYPSGQARFWCPRSDPNGLIQIDSNIKMGQSGRRRRALDSFPSLRPCTKRREIDERCGQKGQIRIKASGC